VKRRYCLRGRKRFQEIRRQGRRWVHSLIVLGALPNGQDLTRCGFVVSRKVGKAVERNQIRRRLREAVRHRYPQIQPGWDLVWIARPPICRAAFSQIGDAIEVLLQRAGVWQDQE
jgi:ribonuclease P protein component